MTVDRERYDAEKEALEESFRRPVTIQFGAEFDMISGSPKEPIYGVGVVRDIKSDGFFNGDFVIREVCGSRSGPIDTVRIEIGGDYLRTNILRMTGRIITVDEYLAGVIRGYTKPPDPESDLYKSIRQTLLELSTKGSRVLAGHVS